jgi:hypothetical protein
MIHQPPHPPSYYLHLFLMLRAWLIAHGGLW